MSLASLDKTFKILNEIEELLKDEKSFMDINKIRRAIELMDKIPIEHRTTKYYILLNILRDQHKLLTIYYKL